MLVSMWMTSYISRRTEVGERNTTEADRGVHGGRSVVVFGVSIPMGKDRWRNDGSYFTDGVRG